MAALPIWICEVSEPAGVKYYVTCLPHDHVFERGLAPEAIIGMLTRPLEPGEPITPATFARNRVFVDFLHGVIARFGPTLPSVLAEAARQGDGWVYLIDQRTPTPRGAVPPEDILGAFQVKGGQVVAGSYQPNPKHLIFSAHGFFQLGSELQACLLDELLILGSRELCSEE